MAGATATGDSEASQNISGSGRYQNYFGPTRQLDVAHCRFSGSIPKIRAYSAAGYRLERSSGHEFPRRLSHHYLYFGSALTQAPDQVRALIGGDTAGHT